MGRRRVGESVGEIAMKEKKAKVNDGEEFEDGEVFEELDGEEPNWRNGGRHTNWRKWRKTHEVDGQDVTIRNGMVLNDQGRIVGTIVDGTPYWFKRWDDIMREHALQRRS